jgi:hypothetical protein
MGNQHPDFSAIGANGSDILPTTQQVDCLVEFLNFADADQSAYFAAIDSRQVPVLYSIVDTAEAAAGETFFNDRCSGCHDLAFVLDYLTGDGKFSELAHKARWGSPDTAMTRASMGDPTSQNVADLLLYLQREGGTGFAVNSGLTGTWWGGESRSGEGFLLDFGTVGKSLTLFGSFYTYDNLGNQVWLTAQSTAINGTEVTVAVFITNGAMWGADFDPADVILVAWGTGTFIFQNCTSGSVSLVPNGDMQALGFTDLTYPLSRDALESAIACPTPAP